VYVYRKRYAFFQGSEDTYDALSLLVISRKKSPMISIRKIVINYRALFQYPQNTYKSAIFNGHFPQKEPYNFIFIGHFPQKEPYN